MKVQDQANKSGRTLRESYLRLGTRCRHSVTAMRSRLTSDDGVISTETAIVGAVVLVAAVTIAARLTGLFEDAVQEIPESIDQ